LIAKSRFAGSACGLALVTVHRCEAQGELLSLAPGLGYWTPLLSGSLEGLMILGSGRVAGAELGLLDTTLKGAILISLAILGLGFQQSDGLWFPW